VLRDFWRDFIAAVNDIKDLRVGQVLDGLNEMLAPHIFPERADGGDPRICPQCGIGHLSLKVGKFGAFLGCSNYPDCRFTRQFKTDEEGAAQGGALSDTGLGDDPETGLPVLLRSGRFGPYIQLGETENGEKPKRASIPAGTDPAAVTLDYALRLLSLPREVGKHPETGKTITAGFGRYGPFLEHDGKYVKIDADEVFTIHNNRAVALIAEGNSGKGRPGATRQSVIAALGEHPDGGGKVEVLAGRYGPYVKHGKINATIPKDISPEALTMDEAVRLLAAKAANGGAKPARGKAAAKPKAKANGAPKAAAAQADEPTAKEKPAAKAKAKTRAKPAAETPKKSKSRSKPVTEAAS
jgi:DNA topoisomerase-1